MTWLRTAAKIQFLLGSIFELVGFYEDEFFWVAPLDLSNGVDAAWLQNVFGQVASEVRGWKLDPDNDERGERVVLSGLGISMYIQVSQGRLNPGKSAECLADIYRVRTKSGLVSASGSVKVMR